MKRNLLELVQSILSDMDSENVNSIGDSVEAQQVASVLEDTFFNIVSARDIPEHQRTLSLVSLSDTQRPTHFKYPTNVKEITELLYNNSEDGGVDYRTVSYMDPQEFLRRQTTSDSSNTLVVPDVSGETSMVVGNNAMPSYYTSFDDEHLIMDSYKSSYSSTLAAANTKAFGTIYPIFTISDSFEPDLDDNMLPYLLAEAKSVCFSMFKSGSDPKVEQAARRLKSYTQNDMFRTRKSLALSRKVNYGRS